MSSWMMIAPTSNTNTRFTKVVFPPMSSTNVAMEWGAKKLYSQDDAENVNSLIRTRERPKFDSHS